MAVASWDEAKKYALAGGSGTYGSYDNYANPSSPTQQAATKMAGMYGPPAPVKPAIAQQPKSTQATTSNAAAPMDYKTVLRNAALQFSAPQATFQYNSESDPALQAAAKMMRQGVGVAQANTNARAWANGQGGSSWSQAVGHQIAQQAEDDISTKLIPQYEQQAYGRFQDDQTRARQAALDMLTVGRDMNALDQQGRDNVRADAALTGYMDDPAVREVINRIVATKQQAEQPGVTSEQMAGFRNSADADRSTLLNKYGINADQLGIGYENDYVDAAKNAANFRGVTTLPKQQLDYNQQKDARDYERGVYENDRNFTADQAQREWDNIYKEGQFDWQKAQQLWENQFKEKNFDQSMKEFAAQQGLQWANLSQRDKEFVADQAWKQKNYELDVQKMSAPSKIDAKSSADLYDGLLEDFNSAELAAKAKELGLSTKETARKLVESNKNELTDADYKKLRELINENF